MRCILRNIGVFVDVDNIYYHTRKKFGENSKLDYQRYLNFVKEHLGNNMLRAFAYGVQSGSESTNFIKCLRHYGYEPKFGKANSKEVKWINWNVEICLDVVRLIGKLDVVVIGSCNKELIPLISWIREQGVQCVIVANLISKSLKEAADKYIEISSNLLIENNNSKETTANQVAK